MGDAGRVLRDGAQRHQKHVFGVVRRQMDVLRAGLFVPVFFHTQFQRVDGLAAQVFKAGWLSEVMGSLFSSLSDWSLCFPSLGFGYGFLAARVRVRFASAGCCSIYRLKLASRGR